MKKISIFFLSLVILSCQKETSNFTLKAHVKGLKKGTVYLQRLEDSTLVTIDSAAIAGNPNFELHTDLNSAEMLYLKLNKNSNQEDVITFFADKGITEINATLKDFEWDADIKGSKQHELLEEYQEMISKFNNKNLDLIKEDFDARIEKDSAKMETSVFNQNNHLKRKYLYTVNFAITHKDSEIAPYLAISQIQDARVKFLDTIYNSLTPSVKSSKYGMQLNELIKTRKSQ